MAVDKNIRFHYSYVPQDTHNRFCHALVVDADAGEVFFSVVTDSPSGSGIGVYSYVVKALTGGDNYLQVDTMVNIRNVAVGTTDYGAVHSLTLDDTYLYVWQYAVSIVVHKLLRSDLSPVLDGDSNRISQRIVSPVADYRSIQQSVLTPNSKGVSTILACGNKTGTAYREAVFYSMPIDDLKGMPWHQTYLCDTLSLNFNIINDQDDTGDGPDIFSSGVSRKVDGATTYQTGWFGRIEQDTYTPSDISAAWIRAETWGLQSSSGSGIWNPVTNANRPLRGDVITMSGFENSENNIEYKVIDYYSPYGVYTDPTPPTVENSSSTKTMSFDTRARLATSVVATRIWFSNALDITNSTIAAVSDGFECGSGVFDDVSVRDVFNVTGFTAGTLNTKYEIVSTSTDKIVTDPAPATTESAGNSVTFAGENPVSTQDFQTEIFSTTADPNGTHHWAVGWMPKDDETDGGMIHLYYYQKKDTSNSDRCTLDRAWSIRHTPGSGFDETNAFRGATIKILEGSATDEDPARVMIGTIYMPHDGLGDKDDDVIQTGHVICLRRLPHSGHADKDGLLGSIGGTPTQATTDNPENVLCTIWGCVLGGATEDADDYITDTKRSLIGFMKCDADDDYFYLAGSSDHYESSDGLDIPAVARVPKNLEHSLGDTLYDSYRGERYGRIQDDEYTIRTLYDRTGIGSYYSWFNLEYSTHTLYSDSSTSSDRDSFDVEIDEGTATDEYVQKTFRQSDEGNHYIHFLPTDDYSTSGTIIGSWEDIDDPIDDPDDVDYVYANASGYLLCDHGGTDLPIDDFPEGKIQSVEVVVRGRKTASTAYAWGTTVHSTDTSFGALFTEHFSETVSTSHIVDITEHASAYGSGHQWTWAEIKALKFGAYASYRSYLGAKRGIVNQVYLRINFSPTKELEHTYTGGMKIGGAASTAFGVTVGCSLGSASITTFPTTIYVGVSINATLAEQNVSSFPAAIYVGTTISVTLSETSISCSQADVQTETIFDCSLSELSIVGYQADVQNRTVLDLSLSEISIVGYQVDIQASQIIAATISDTNVVGYQAVVSSPVTIDATLSNLGVSVYDAEVVQYRTVTCSLSEATTTAFDATIIAPLIIDASVSSVNVGCFGSEIIQRIDVDCSLSEMTVTGLNAVIAAALTVDATASLINAGGLSAEIVSTINIDCSLSSLNIVGYAVEILETVSINTHLSEFGIVTYSASISTEVIPITPIIRTFAIDQDIRVFSIDKENRTYSI